MIIIKCIRQAFQEIEREKKEIREHPIRRAYQHDILLSKEQYCYKRGLTPAYFRNKEDVLNFELWHAGS